MAKSLRTGPKETFVAFQLKHRGRVVSVRPQSRAGTPQVASHAGWTEPSSPPSCFGETATKCSQADRRHRQRFMNCRAAAAPLNSRCLDSLVSTRRDPVEQKARSRPYRLIACWSPCGNVCPHKPRSSRIGDQERSAGYDHLRITVVGLEFKPELMGRGENQRRPLALCNGSVPLPDQSADEVVCEGGCRYRIPVSFGALGA